MKEKSTIGNRMAMAAVVLPVFVGIFFAQDDSYKLSAGRFIVLTLIIAAYNLLLYLRKTDWERRKTALICSGMSLFTMAVIQGVCFLRQTESVGEGMVTFLGMALAVIVLGGFFLLIRSEKGITENVIVVVIFAAFLVRIFYVVMTQSYLYQNDMAAFDDEGYGHFGYIYYLFSDGKLPDINPMEYYELYQPPLHHAISAVFLKLLQLLGCSPDIWEEQLQVLLLVYSMLVVVFIDKIAVRMKLCLEGRLAAVCFAGFFPYGIMMSGSLNNDQLMTLFMVMAIYFTLKWYEDPNIKTILIMAVCIGCSMMSKVSGVLIAPAMAALMLLKLWKDRKQWVKYIKQFVCFGLIAFPLGMWHPVYNLLKWGMPFGFVPAMGPTSGQFIGEYDKWQRFYDFNGAFDQLTVQGDRFHGFTDYNLPVTLIKFAVFGESNYYDSSQLTNILAPVVFWATLALFALMPAAFVIWFLLDKTRAVNKAFVLVGTVVSLCYYVRFCWQYPYVCTMHVRYIMGAVYLGCLTIGATVTTMQEKFAPGNAVSEQDSSLPVPEDSAETGVGTAVSVKIMTGLSLFYITTVIVLMVGMERLLP